LTPTCPTPCPSSAPGLHYKTVAFKIRLLATRGRPERVATGVSSLVVSPRQEHSRKPDEVRERIVRVFGDVPRAELFARRRVSGWQAWGNEVECDFVL